jgi:acetolactate synthase-1/3 small subunit
MVERFAVGLILNNRFGVLDRIAGLYAKRCYNIDAISAGVTENPAYTRMTVVSTGDEYMKDQVIRQLEKLIDVRSVTLLDPDSTAFAQHMFIKMHLTGNQRGSSKHQVLELINEYGGKIVDFGEEYLTAEITGSMEKVDSFIEKVRDFGILELSRSGDIAIGLGIENTLRVEKNNEE